MSIAQPYLLFLGDVTDPIAAKTVEASPCGAQIHAWDN
ncbi:EBNA-1 nuclear protein [Vibrio ishigakensis]|uniref:EBNA-1 nuclear protein n=1 Tax=Vibrio ishigakensis TaxID=1481914 RepID=A0A0B8PB37_9VIBR|nr:EBNA-1 nuclear protein [Vibrio ishigakensis]